MAPGRREHLRPLEALRHVRCDIISQRLFEGGQINSLFALDMLLKIFE